MASPQQQQLKALLPSTPSPFISRVLEASKNGANSLTDESIWQRLRDAGFDEESIKRKDKAALISYISKLESEIYEYQHHLGLLLLERKEWTAKYEQIEISAKSAEAMHKRDQAAHLAALAEARKREESLKKALGVEKLCVSNIERALHEMRAETAEIKLASESKLAEARNMMEDAQERFIEAESKLHAAESLQAEASRYRSAAERKLQEVEAREDGLRRQTAAFKAECDAKEKEISIERQCLFDRQRILQQGQERLLEGQALLNQREEFILERSQKLSRLEKELETEKVKMEKDFKVLNEDRADLDLTMVSLASREESVVKREALLDKKEQELLILQEKISSKEYDEIQRLLAEHEAAVQLRKTEFEAELELKRKLMEDELKTKRKACELKEADLNHKEEEMQKRSHELKLLSSALGDKENDIVLRMKSLEEKEQSLKAVEETIEGEKMSIQKEKDEIIGMRLDLKKCNDSLEDEKAQVIQAQEKLEITQNERNELLVLQTKLKDEIDSFRAQKLELMAELDELKAEKEKFENEWQLIDEKREELQREAERVAEERKVVSKFLKDEQETLKLEKDALRDQFKRDVESLACEREAFMNTMEHEHSEWFSKIQKERMNFLKDIDLQKSELENSIIKRREEIEQYLREKEEAFEQEKTRELQYISSQKELVAKELEHVEMEMKRLENERAEITIDREQREKECSEIKISIEELQNQREKLQKQRELLHVEREEIQNQIQHLKELVAMKFASDNMTSSDIQQPEAKSNKKELQADKSFNEQAPIQDKEKNLDISKDAANDSLGKCVLPKQACDNASPPVSSPLSWVKRCTELIFKSPDKDVDRNIVANFEGNKSPLQKTCRDDENIVSSQLPSFQGTSAKCDRPEPKRKIVQRKETSSQKGEEKSILTNGGQNALFAGRKRRKGYSSHDPVDVLNETHKKTRRRRDVAETLEDGNTSIRQVPFLEVGKSLRSFNQAAADREEANGHADESHEISETTAKSNDADACTEKAKVVSSEKGTLALPHGIYPGGGSNGCEVLHLVENGALSAGLHQQGQTKGQKKALKQDFLDGDEESVNEHLNRASESKHESSDGEVEDEDEEHTTVKEKLWNFLIT